jgi:predicted enzyme related to lactoylglutathione lyase
MPIQLASIVLDCHDPQKLSEFWAAAIGYATTGVFNQYVVLTDPTKKGPALILQGVSEPRPGKNRMHWDWTAASAEDYQAEIARLEGLGATKAREIHEMGINWAVMHDPEGNEFCVAVH